jgi:hypothetical protein
LRGPEVLKRLEMAETALSMARSMLGGAVRKAASAATDGMRLLMGVYKDIWYVRMHFFSRHALPSYIFSVKPPKSLLLDEQWLNIFNA